MKVLSPSNLTTGCRLLLLHTHKDISTKIISGYSFIFPLFPITTRVNGERKTRNIGRTDDILQTQGQILCVVHLKPQSHQDMLNESGSVSVGKLCKKTS